MELLLLIYSDLFSRIFSNLKLETEEAENGIKLVLPRADDMKNVVCEVISFVAKYRKVLQIRLDR